MVSITKNDVHVFSAAYYQNSFPINQVKALLGEPLPEREFAFQFNDGSFMRGVFFPDENELMDFLITKAPCHVYVGARYHGASFVYKRSITDLEWKGKEFILDLDINLQQWRRCGCQGSRYCLDCLKFLIIGSLFYHELLTTHFGFRKVQWFFSGNRGVHCWVSDDMAKNLDRTTRTAIVDYMSIQGEALHRLNHELRQSITAPLLTTFFHLATLEELEELAFPDQAIRTKINAMRIGIQDLRAHFPLPAPKTISRITDKILIPIDRPVSIDPTHLIRLPFSVNGDSNRVVRPLNHLTDVDEWINTFFADDDLSAGPYHENLDLIHHCH